jgi:Flp pilus assembly protein protease CpaA
VGCCRLIGDFVVAGSAAGFAVHQAVRTDADIEYILAKAAVFLALALTFRHFALRAMGFGLAGSGGHNQ